MAKRIICNKCGKEFNMFDYASNLHVECRMGYGTTLDGSLIELDLCNNCLATFINECAVSPIVEEN